MMADKSVKVRSEEKTLFMSRLFEAPRTVVFEAFSDCRHLSQWWAPAGWSVTQCEMDFQPGGSWHYQLSSADGATQSWTLASYKEIETPERIAYDERFVDQDRAPIGGMPVQHIGMRFTELDGLTRLDYQASFDSEEDMQKIVDMGVVEYFSSTLERLEEHLAQA